MTNSALRTLTVINTRPLQQSYALSQRITQLGGTAIDIPSLAIQAINIDALRTTLATTCHAEHLAIFISHNAVIHTQELWHAIAQDQRPRMLAVGPGTAKTLHACNLPVAAIPQTFNSESLLALPLLQQVKDKIIYLCCGQDTRPLIATTLHARGAQVIPIVCYKRLATTLTAHHIATLLQNQPNATVITSSSGLINWQKMLLATQQLWLFEIPTLVVAAKQVALAEQLGFATVLLCENATEECILAKLLQC